MRVLMIHNAGRSDIPSGEQIVFDSEAKALRDVGVDVVTKIVTNDEIEQSIFKRAMSAATLIWSPRVYLRFRRLLAEIKPDIVHAHSIFPRLGASVFSACRAARVSVVQTLHNYRWLCVEGGFFRDHKICTACLDCGMWQGVKHRCARKSVVASGILAANNFAYVKQARLFKLVDQFVAVSNYVKQKHVEAGFPSDRLTVKYNGIHVPSKIDQFSRHNKKTVTFVGRLSPAKGTGILRDLPKLNPTCQLKIVGAGSEEASLRDHFRALGITNAKWCGRLVPSETTAQIQSSHCVVVPSLSPESFGLVAAESMAHGVPVIVSNAGALAELVQASGGGIVVQIESGAAGFTAAIHRVLQDETSAREMGLKGHEFAQREFNLKTSAERLMQIYENVLSR